MFQAYLLLIPNLILVIVESQVKSAKKKVPVELITNLEIYTRYCWIADEEQKRWKKSLQKNVILLEGGNSLSNIFNGNNLKKSLGNPALEKLKSYGHSNNITQKIPLKTTKAFFLLFIINSRTSSVSSELLPNDPMWPLNFCYDPQWATWPFREILV